MDATQQKGSPKQLRGRSLGTKLSEAEYAQCEKSAARRGQTLSEWCRQALLDAVAGPAPRPEAEVILSEILALRKIVTNLANCGSLPTVGCRPIGSVRRQGA